MTPQRFVMLREMFTTATPDPEQPNVWSAREPVLLAADHAPRQATVVDFPVRNWVKFQRFTGLMSSQRTDGGRALVGTAYSITWVSAEGVVLYAVPESWSRPALKVAREMIGLPCPRSTR